MSSESIKFTDNVEMDDVRVTGYDPLIPPQILMQEIPLSSSGKNTIFNARKEAAKILIGSDDRLLVIIGPCSV
jgi:3-deoxy-7-phosphoheptulonate synthase